MAISNSYVKLPKGKALREHQFLFWLPNFDGFSGVDVSYFFPHMGLNHVFFVSADWRRVLIILCLIFSRWFWWETWLVRDFGECVLLKHLNSVDPRWLTFEICYKWLVFGVFAHRHWKWWLMEVHLRSIVIEPINAAGVFVFHIFHACLGGGSWTN